jgi:hypothetical protein
MNRQILFLFFLLTTASVINAIPFQLTKRGTTFGECTTGADPKPPTFTVTMDPDPVVPNQPVKFTISGSLSADLPSGAILDVAFLDGDYLPIYDFPTDFCRLSDSKCPVKANTPFTFSWSVTPGNLRTDYYIEVALFDASYEYITCNYATIGSPKPSPASKSSH